MAKVRLAVGIIWLLSLLSPMSQTTPALADQVTAKWLRVNTPTEGTAGNWVLANGSDALHLTMAIDGTLYAYGKSLTYTLYKSTDSGYSWSSTGKVTDAIVGIAAAPDDAGVIYYATTANVYKSTNAGDSFASLPPNPGGAGSNNVEITSIAAAEDGTVAVGTRDTDPHDYGDVYTLKESESFTWVDTNIGDYDVYTVAYPPISSQLVAVATDGDDTIVSSNIGDAGWGNTIGDVTITDLEPASASLAFPNDYHPDVTAGANILFMGIDSDGGLKGDVYKITNMTAPNSSVATDLNIGIAYGLDKVDVTSVAISGEAANARLLAGVADSVQVYFSTDSGSHWTISSKPPTGESKTYVLMAPDFASSGRAYAATSEAESAVSYTVDGGLTWNQVSLIDTTITTILDLAPSPDYSQDNTLFMLTWGAAYGLWQSLNGGARWERVFSSALTSVDSLNLVELPPQYGADNQIVLLAGESNSNPVIWKSTDNGQTFLSPLTTKDPATGATFSINTWAIVDDTTLFIGSFDGSSGQVYHTTNSGLSYSTPAVVGSQSLNSIVLSPTYEQDETILIGNTNGWIYWSKDNGDSFEPLPPGAASAPLTGSVTVAFDSQFSSNNTVYAASDTADKGIYRFIIGIRTTWESIDSTLATGGMLKQLVSADGTLYATNFNGDGGMERCLNPTYPLGPTFEAATNGLDSDATLNGLWLGDNRLWAVDTTNIRLMTYIDSLTIPVTLTSPTDKVPGIGTIINYTINDVSLDWEALTGATNYSWQLNYITDFSTIPTDFEGTTRASSVHLPTLAPATTYYWRVRATQPVVSPWSAKWSFTTSLGDAAIAPKLASPEAGATGVALKPIFQWETVAGADSYELIVSTDINFNNPTISKCDDYALPGTAWQANPALEPNTTYYWKVRAISSGTHSAWSAVGAFITESPTELLVSPAPQAPPASSPSVLPQLITSNWLLYLIGALLVTIILLIITLLIVIIRLSRI